MNIVIRTETFSGLTFAQRSIFFNLLLLCDQGGFIDIPESILSDKMCTPRTSFHRVLLFLKEQGYINIEMSDKVAKGKKTNIISICNFDDYINVQNDQINVQINKPIRGELAPYIKSKGYKFTAQAFTSYADAHGWAGHQGETWKEFVDRFALTEEAATSANRRNTFVPPTPEEAEKTYREGGYHFDLNQFYNHYSSNGWMVGRVKMCDLNATMRTWENELKKKHPELFIEKREKTEREIQYEEAMMDKFPRLMRVAYPLTLTQYEYLKGVALERNEIDKLVSVLTRFNGSDLSRIRVAYDSICAAMNYPKI